MGAAESRQHDDGQPDPDNPIVPFRMSDRRVIWEMQEYVSKHAQMDRVVNTALAVGVIILSGMELHLW